MFKTDQLRPEGFLWCKNIKIRTYPLDTGVSFSQSKKQYINRQAAKPRQVMPQARAQARKDNKFFKGEKQQTLRCKKYRWPTKALMLSLKPKSSDSHGPFKVALIHSVIIATSSDYCRVLPADFLLNSSGKTTATISTN